ncbi:MAG TPA: proton-conducting transporter membrane subunit, partial [Spirochaetia bacterium]|nr:proton-conducting transporter membrane subunit [Spirochaetia bacterium]
MYSLLWIVPTLPLLGYLILTFAGRRMPKSAAGAIGVLSIGISALLTILLGIQFLNAPPAGGAYNQHLWNWISIGNLTIDFGFRFDSLTLTMMFVITFVGFLIHLFSTEYMKGDDDFHLFFAYMNLFVSSMLILVMADNLIFLYLGWEGVGLCSYLLIGFWYKDPANGAAARKAFIVTRIGDVSMLLGIAILVANLGTLNIQDILSL